MFDLFYSESVGAILVKIAAAITFVVLVADKLGWYVTLCGGGIIVLAAWWLDMRAMNKVTGPTIT